MPSFELFDLVLILGTGQGLFLAATLPRVSNTNKSVIRILAALILMASVMLVGRLIYVRLPALWPMEWSLLPDVVIFLFGPFTYILVNRLCVEGRSNFTLSLFHYIPAGIQILVFLYFLTSETTFLEYWQRGVLKLPFGIIEGSAIILNLVYWLQSYRVLVHYDTLEEHQLSFNQELNRFVGTFLWAILIFLIAWVFSYAGYYFGGFYTIYLSYDMVWMSIPMFIYVIGYYSIKQPEFLRLPAAGTKLPESESPRLSPQEITTLNERLEKLFQKEKLFLNSELTLADLSEALNSSIHDTSWLLNNVQKSTFYDYVNGFRVDEFLNLLGSERFQNYTMLAVALEAGFRSKSTFNKAFKNAMGYSPTAYLKSLQIQSEEIN